VSIAAQFLAAGGVAIDLIASPEVEQRWAEPSVLEGYRVGGLAAHLGRALLTVDIYLAGDPPDPGDKVVDAPTYFAGALADHDPIESTFHAEVRRRGESAAEAGQVALVEELRAAQRRLGDVELDPTYRVSVLAGTAIPLSEYLKTRLVELAIHATDLADSVELAAPLIDSQTWAVVARTIADTALSRGDSRSVALGLSRGDRYRPACAF
jgi:hypothetical protein